MSAGRSRPRPNFFGLTLLIAANSPAEKRFATLKLTAVMLENTLTLIFRFDWVGWMEGLERETGFEPATSTLARSHSTN